VKGVHQYPDRRATPTRNATAPIVVAKIITRARNSPARPTVLDMPCPPQ